MTNFERIKNMTVEEMAEFNITYIAETNEMPYYETTDGTIFDYDKKQKAIQYEINWLNSESEE